MSARTILVAEGHAGERKRLFHKIKSQGYKCIGADCADAALTRLGQESCEIAVVALDLPDMNGIELFKIITQISPKTSVIIVAGVATLESSIEAFRLGAIDYLVRPFDPGALLAKIRRVLEHQELVEKTRTLRMQLKQDYNFGDIIAKSAEMRQVCELIRRVAKTASNVLVSGNSGTGKELVARAIHLNSHRLNSPFVTVNCAAISDALFESELFGHTKGAFTNAIRDKDGLMKVAAPGTLFLDEVACLSLAAQSKLLRAIESDSIMPVGATDPIPIDVRLIVSTNHHLEDEVALGTFREDLFYRLNVFEISLPSLAERGEDIALLVQHFIRKYAREMGKKVDGVEPQVLQLLAGFEWKGEVRELENVIERAMIFADGDRIAVSDLPDYLHCKSEDRFVLDYNKTLKHALDDFERHFILAKIKLNGGRRLHAFRELGLSESSFYRKIERLGIKESLPHKHSKH